MDFACGKNRAFQVRQLWALCKGRAGKRELIRSSPSPGTRRRVAILLGLPLGPAFSCDSMGFFTDTRWSVSDGPSSVQTKAHTVCQPRGGKASLT